MQISYENFLTLAEKVYLQIDKSIEYKGIVCPFNGGLYLSDYLSRRLDLPIFCISIKSYDNKIQGDIKIKNFMPIIEPGEYLIADDIYDTGKTVEEIIKFYSFQNKFNFDVCVLITNKVIDRVNVYGMFNITKEWVTFFWEKI